MPSTKRAPRVDGRRKPRPGVDEQKRVLVDAAVALYVERNTRDVSIAEICQAADVSRDTFYRCFADKAALIEGIWDRAAHRHVETFIFDALPHGGSIEDWLEGAIDRLLDAVFEERAIAHFAFVEYGDPGSPAHAAINAMFDRYAELVGTWLREDYGREASPLFLKAIMAAVQWILLQTIQAGVTGEGRREAKTAVIQLASAAFASLEPAPPGRGKTSARKPGR